jgi:hypothetical protein
MRVKVYWNLHKRCFSVQHRGRVIAHAEAIALQDVEFRVQQGGRQRCIRENRKNVHAFVTGKLLVEEGRNREVQPMCSEMVEVAYNPHKYATFVRRDGPEVPVKFAEAVACTIDANRRPVITALDPKKG